MLSLSIDINLNGGSILDNLISYTFLNIKKANIFICVSPYWVENACIFSYQITTFISFFSFQKTIDFKRR